MSRKSIYSNLDRHTTNLEAALVCCHKHLCSRKDCKRIDYSDNNSMAFVALPNGSWNNCFYFIGD